MQVMLSTTGPLLLTKERYDEQSQTLSALKHLRRCQPLRVARMDHLTTKKYTCDKQEYS